MIKNSRDIIKDNCKVKDNTRKYNKKGRIVKESEVVTAILKESDCH